MSRSRVWDKKLQSVASKADSSTRKMWEREGKNWMPIVRRDNEQASGLGYKYGKHSHLSNGMNRSNQSYVLLLFGFLVFMALAMYYDGLDTSFYYDSAAKLYLKRHLYDQGFLTALGTFPQRPLPVASFYLNYLLSGMQAGYFRLFNVFLLAATSTVAIILLYFILDTTTSGTRITANQKKVLSVLLGLLFFAHPLQVYVTLYIWQRMALMASLFYLSSLAIYIAVRSGKIQNRLAGYGACFICFVCAMLSKENSITLPVVLIACEIGLFRSTRRNILARGVIYTLILVGLLSALSFVQYPHGNRESMSGFLSTISAYYDESGLTLEAVLLTQARVLFTYVSLVVAPFPTRLQLVRPQFIAVSLFDPPYTVLYAVGAILLIVVGILLLRVRPLSGMGIIFFVLNLVPESLLVPQYAFFSYRAVLPMFGILLLLADGITALVAISPQLWIRRWLWITVCTLLGGMVILLGEVTNNRAVIWSNNVRFWKETVEQFPKLTHRVEKRAAAQAYANLGYALLAEGRYLAAIQYLEKAISLRPDSSASITYLAVAKGRIGQVCKAEVLFRRAMEFSPNRPFIHTEFGKLLQNQGRLDDAIMQFQVALSLDPHNQSIRNTLKQLNTLKREEKGKNNRRKAKPGHSRNPQDQ